MCHVSKLLETWMNASWWIFTRCAPGKSCFLTIMLHYQRGLPARASVTMVSTQDHVQSQSLFNIKDSNKVSNHRAMRHLLVVHFKKNTSGCALASYKSAFQEERERRVLVRKFKFEEPRREQIDELKVCIVFKGTAQTLLHLSLLSSFGLFQ